MKRFHIECEKPGVWAVKDGDLVVLYTEDLNEAVRQVIVLEEAAASAELADCFSHRKGEKEIQE